MFDSDLRPVMEMNFPRGVRNFGLDSRGKYVVAPNFFTGRLRLLDIEQNKLSETTYFVGKGARSVKPAENGKVLISNSCGLVEFDTDAAALKN